MTIALEAEGAARRRRRFDRAATRVATIGDQLFAALSNFALTLSISRAFGAEEVTAYGMGLAFALLIQGAHRHAITIPLMLQAQHRVLRRRGGIFAQHTLVLACALMLGLMGIFVTSEAHAGSHSLLIAESACVLLLVYSQLEFARAVLVKLNQPFYVLASSIFYFVVCLSLSVTSQMHWITYYDLLGALSVAMLLHALVLAVIVREFDLIQGYRLLMADIYRYGWWSVVATATNAGYTHLPLLILGAMAEPKHAAAFVATRSLMQPLQVLIRGLDAADKSFFSDEAKAPHSRHAFLLTLRLAIPNTVAATLFVLGMSFYSNELIALAYGPKFAYANSTLLAWLPVFLIMSVTMPFEALVYSRKDFRRYYMIRAVASVVALALTVPLVMLWDSVGAILACGVGGLIAMTGTVLLLWGRR
jgi:O-antigen/teichoic acid export membrane protein